MGLVESPRLKPGDREAWERLVKYDRALSASPRLAALEEKALDRVREAVKYAGYAGTTWGKDSTVLTHLISRVTDSYPVVWVRVEGLENPETDDVRDAFLQTRAIAYEEISISSEGIRRWWHGADFVGTDHGPDVGFAEAAKRHGAHHMSGVRAEESTTRRLTMQRNGFVGPGSSRPIGDWTAVDVFAYLAKYDLPVHPAYAMSRGGVLDRRWLRVSTIGGVRGTGKGRREWEEAYYPDIIRAATRGL